MSRRFKPFKKQFTFLVLPDASSPVLRFRVSAALLVAIPVLICSLLAALLIFFLIHEHSTGRIDQLNRQLSSASGSYESQLSSKDAAIEQLQTELIHLSEQAKDVETSMTDLYELESDMKSLVGIPTAKANTETGDGVGGEMAAVTDDDIEQLISETRTRLVSIRPKINELKSRMLSTKLEVQKKSQILRQAPTFWPTKSQHVTSEFGVRIDPFTQHPGVHNGIDISGDVGDSVYAAADGIVKTTGMNAARGNFVVITHPSGMITEYMHLSKIVAHDGDKVKQGDTIGLLGSTGRSTGPHLHFEVLKNEMPVDPRPYLNMAIKEIPTDVQKQKSQD